ncbi:MAG: outer membrane protein assembly factor BamD [Planctomycetes bacterium]|nr:outer membrane protein assembly factor BamD [Planctomycetota bacterium]
MKQSILFTAGMIFLAGCEFTFDGKKTARQYARWSADEGGWVPPASQTSSPTAAQMRAEARKAMDGGAYVDALSGLTAMQRAFPDSQEATEAQTYFLIGECRFLLKNYEEAHQDYLKVLKRNPGEDLLNQALSRIYSIGLLFLQGNAKRSFAGFHYRSPSHGVEILTGEDGLVTRYPYLSYSDDALIEIARYYFDKKEYPEAEQVYERLVKDYPDREWYEIAEYQLAVTIHQQIRGVDYDQSLLKKARSKYNLYRNHHPRGDHIDQAREALREISEMEAQHDLKVAKYYLRESRPEAALYYLRSVLLNSPNTEAAREAREIYRHMAVYSGQETEGKVKASSS